MARLFSELMRFRAVTICGAILFASVGPCAAKYIEQKPIFDTTYLPKKQSPFQLGIKHTSIVYPLNLQARGDARVVNLIADANDSVLRGAVETAVPTSTINTIEHGMKSQFHLDLTALIPKIAPDISRHLDAEIEKAQRALAGRVAEMPPARPPSPNAIPRIPQVARVAESLTPKLKAALAQTPNINKPVVGNVAIPPQKAKPMPSIADQASPMFAAGMGGGAGGAGGSGGAGGAGTLGGIPSGGSGSTAVKMPVPNTNIKVSMPNVQPNTAAPLSIPQHRSTSTDVGAQLGSAETKAKLIAQKTPADLDALKAQAHLLPKMPSPDTDVNGELIGQTAILWDAWHKQFAKLAGDALIKSVNSANNPLGANTVSVTITPDQHLSIAITKGSNAKFDAATVAAYRSLDGNPALAYPKGSLRSAVSFLVDNKHTKAGVASVVSSKTLTGDKEVLHR
jgi:hypothetical protein